ncbi:uncharacterized protein LOC126373352 [Pectinophora gossypiella]|nr:uncharacterized protein LOC126373352 [Pectinophora gossypiella]
MSCNEEKEVLIRMIDMYRDMSYLWQRDHELYMNREMRAEGLKVLLEVYKQFDKDADITRIRKKLENLRTTYVKELKKVRASKQTAADENEIYVPTLWYYDHLSFLESTVEYCRIEPDAYENDSSSVDEETAIVANSSSSQKKRMKKVPLIPKQENIFLPIEACMVQQLPVETCMTQKLPAETYMTQKDEEFEVYGRSIGFQLKDLNKRQLTIAQKVISDILFYAKLDQLTESSYVVCRPSNESEASHSGFHQNKFYTVPIITSQPSNCSSPSPSHQTQSP